MPTFPPDSGAGVRSFDRVNVMYPRGVVTGGPEALHQLVDCLRKHGLDAALTPANGSEQTPRSDAYASYDAPERRHDFREPHTALVFPETLREGFRTEQPAWCWWLSVDDSDLWRAARRSRNGTLATRRAKTGTMARRITDLIDRARLKNKIGTIEHLAQSSYAWAFIHEHHHAMPSMLTDYVTVDVLDRVPDQTERPVVAFNPAKGERYILEVQRQFRGGSVEWLPLQGMGRTEVRNALMRAHIYLDLGHHPGKDRLPREAAACGAVVAVLRTGAAAFSADVPLPGIHKIDPLFDIAKEATRTLSTILRDTAHHHAMQEGYREKIRGERARFEREVRAVFVDRRHGFDDVDIELNGLNPDPRGS